MEDKQEQNTENGYIYDTYIANWARKKVEEIEKENNNLLYKHTNT